MTLPDHLMPELTFTQKVDPRSGELNHVDEVKRPDSLTSDLMELLPELIEERKAQVEESPFDENEQVQMLGHLEFNFYTKQGYPTWEELKELTRYTDVQLRLLMTQVNERLELRGLPHYPVPSQVEPVGWKSSLDPLFVIAVSEVTNVTNKASKEAKLKKIGVTPRQWDAWLLSEENYNYYKYMVKSQWNRAEDAAQLGIMAGIEKQDLQAIRYYHEFTGRFKPSTELNVNLGVIVAHMMEIFSRYVDPATLSKIADELNVIEVKEIDS
jgi:hypothetical protein